MVSLAWETLSWTVWAEGEDWPDNDEVGDTLSLERWLLLVLEKAERNDIKNILLRVLLLSRVLTTQGYEKGQ